MAVVNAVSNVGAGKLQVVRSAVAQANTGQTDWVNVPAWARAALVTVNWTSGAGTTPLLDFRIDTTDPVSRDDAHASPLDGWDGVTQLTAPSRITVAVGPHRTSLDDTGPDYHIGTLLPPVIGLVTTLDRTSLNETYTYTISIVWV